MSESPRLEGLAHAIEVLSLHNEWRRGAEIDMCHPKLLGEATDEVLNAARKWHNSQLPSNTRSIKELEALAKTLVDAINGLGHLEVVHGDSIHRLQPGSGMVVNSSLSWFVSEGERSSHKESKKLERIHEALAEAAKLGIVP